MARGVSNLFNQMIELFRNYTTIGKIASFCANNSHTAPYSGVRAKETENQLSKPVGYVVTLLRYISLNI